MTDRVIDRYFVTVLMATVSLPPSIMVLLTYATLVHLACWSISRTTVEACSKAFYYEYLTVYVVNTDVLYCTCQYSPLSPADVDAETSLISD